MRFISTLSYFITEFTDTLTGKGSQVSEKF